MPNKVKRKQGRPAVKVREHATEAIRVGKSLYDAIKDVQEERRTNNLKWLSVDDILNLMWRKAVMFDRLSGPDALNYIESGELIRAGFRRLVQQSDEQGDGCIADALLTAMETTLSDPDSARKVTREVIRFFADQEGVQTLNVADTGAFDIAPKKLRSK